MKREKDFGLLVTLMIGIQTAGITVLGLLLDAGEKTILWLIFGAIVAIGLATLRGQAAGLGRILEILEQIREDRSAGDPQFDKKGIPKDSPQPTA